MRRSTQKRLARWFGTAIIVAILGFLLLPGIVVMIAAFNERAILSFPPESLSLKWFVNAVTYPDFRKGLINGLIVTGWASTIALVIGATFAYAIDRFEFRGKAALEAILLSALIVPKFTIGIGFLILAAQVGMTRGFTVVVVTHVVLVVPFVLRSVYVSLRNLDRTLERAAASLGASPLMVLIKIDLPLLIPGLFGGWLFAAILSFNEFTASLFVTSHRTEILPVTMYNYVREFVDPTMAALSTIFIVATAIILIVANRYLGLNKVLAIEESR
jgi:putative spermidine/putrescine transport system permease protein